MNIIKSLRDGISLVFENIKMVPIIYAANIGLAAILAIPVFMTLNDAIGDRGIRDEMVQNFNYDWWAEFNFHAKELEETIRPSLSGGFGLIFDNLELLLTGKFTAFGTWIFIIGIAYLLLAAFMNGGVIGLFADEKRSFSVSRFFSFSGYYFHHFFALALTAVLFFLALYKLLNPAIFGLLDHITAGWMSERCAWFLNLLGYLIFFLIIVFCNMIFDYAKIIVVSERKNSSWLCIWLALKFAFRNFSKTLGLYLLLSSIGVGLVFIFGLILTIITPQQIILLIIAIIFQQMFILTKIWLRLNFYGAQLALYRQKKVQSRVVKKRKV